MAVFSSNWNKREHKYYAEQGAHRYHTGVCECCVELIPCGKRRLSFAKLYFFELKYREDQTYQTQGAAQKHIDRENYKRNGVLTEQREQSVKIAKLKHFQNGHYLHGNYRGYNAEEEVEYHVEQRYVNVASRAAIEIAEHEPYTEGVEELAEVLVEKTEEPAPRTDANEE